MSKETEELDENKFEGFNILKADGLDAPEKASKVKKDKEELLGDEAKEKAVNDALDAAKKEADEAAERKSSKKTITESAEEEEEEQEEEEEHEEEADGSLKPFVNHMASRGLLDYEEGEEFDDSEEGLEKLQAKTISNGIDKWKSNYDEDTRKYLEFVENGGRPSDFHKYYYNEATFEGMKLEGDEEAQKHVIREGLLAAGWDSEEEINDEISLYEDAGKLEAKAESHLKRLQKLEHEQKDLLISAQKKYAQDEADAKEAEWKEFKKSLFEKETLSGFKLTPKVKDEIWEYMTKVVDKKSGASQYKIDSQEKGPEARFIYAYLMKYNWNAEKLERDLKTKVISGVKKKLSNYTDSRNKIKSGTSLEAKEESNSFAGFRKLAN